jgi:hypothetical protein
VEISSSGSGEGPGWVTAPGYSTTHEWLELQGAPRGPQKAALVVIVSHRAGFQACTEIDEQEHRVCLSGHYRAAAATRGLAAALRTQLVHPHGAHGLAGLLLQVDQPVQVRSDLFIGPESSPELPV